MLLYISSSSCFSSLITKLPKNYQKINVNKFRMKEKRKNQKTKYQNTLSSTLNNRDHNIYHPSYYHPPINPMRMFEHNNYDLNNHFDGVLLYDLRCILCFFCYFL